MRVLFLLLLLSRSLVFGQGTFLNLDFEGTTLPYISNQMGGIVSATNAFPSWIVTYGDAEQAQVAYNALVSSASVHLWTRDFAAIPPTPPSFERFSAVFTSNADDPIVSLSQVGTIPNSSTSLVFETWGIFNNTSLQLRFDGNTLPLEASWTPGSLYATWRADVSAFSGQEGELSIVRLIQPDVPGFFRLDNLQFVAIPEPSTWALLALGSAAFFATRRRRK